MTENLRISAAGKAEYESLARFHYRNISLGPHAAIFAVRDELAWGIEHGGVVGVIVYAMPVPNLQLRNRITGGRYIGYGDRQVGLGLLNREVRLISRVIIEPRYRGLGLASRLVRETMSMMNVAMVEAQAVMGRVNPFFAKAGMQSLEGAANVRTARLVELLSSVGIEEEMFVDPAEVHARIERLDAGRGRLLECEIRRFLQAYGKRRAMPDSVERTAYVISKLGDRPVYYYWLNPGFLNEDRFAGGETE